MQLRLYDKDNELPIGIVYDHSKNVKDTHMIPEAGCLSVIHSATTDPGEHRNHVCLIEIVFKRNCGLRG